jgi:hypothetical protein
VESIPRTTGWHGSFARASERGTLPAELRRNISLVSLAECGSRGRDTLRTADALQLAAAFVAAERRPSSLEVITLDDRLAAAARREGFVLFEPPLVE